MYHQRSWSRLMDHGGGPRCCQSLSPSGPFVVAVTTETVVKDDPVCDPTGSWSLMITGVQLHGCCHGNRTRNVMSGMMGGQIRLLRGGGSWMGGLYGVKQTGATLTPPTPPTCSQLKGWEWLTGGGKNNSSEAPPAGQTSVVGLFCFIDKSNESSRTKFLQQVK